ncbi:MAG TPA: glycosyltransferase [Nitrospiraceae bacterium]|jgi:glycosyltransferase involved in cell wall biosynthesis|nr:glycosyltransferase [Nitrospiraceae bacterium]
MRRTLVLINNAGVGGTERRLGRLFARLTAEDRETELIVNSSLWEKLIAGGVVTGREPRVRTLAEPFGWLSDRLRRISPGARFWLSKVDYLLMAVRLLGRYGLASRRLFHLALGGAYVALPLMVVRPGHRFVVSITNPDLAAHVGRPTALPLYRAALSRCTRVDALTVQVREDLIRRGVAAEKVAVSPGSVVDLERFRPAAVKEPWVVFAGRLIEEKNPLLFVEAAALIRRSVPEACFFLCGDGPLASEVEAAVKRLGLYGAMVRGFQADIAPVLAKGAVFVSLQRQDNYPSQSLLEAMASGLACVATDVGLTWRLVDDTTGMRVKPEAASVAEAVVALLRDSDRRRRLGEAARRRVSEEHSEERYRVYVERLHAQADKAGVGMEGSAMR